MALTEASLEEAVDDIRHAVAEAFPDGLPLDNPLMRALDGTEDLAETSVRAPQHEHSIVRLQAICVTYVVQLR